ncbi:MAG: hypothetical protein H6622_05655 [Halobacteriovoraceae bacterium]|nr:hypothetical protein [Halobacteriovoraceae bacterium]
MIYSKISFITLASILSFGSFAFDSGDTDTSIQAPISHDGGPVARSGIFIGKIGLHNNNKSFFFDSNELTLYSGAFDQVGQTEFPGTLFDFELAEDVKNLTDKIDYLDQYKTYAFSYIVESGLDFDINEGDYKIVAVEELNQYVKDKLPLEMMESLDTRQEGPLRTNFGKIARVERRIGRWVRSYDVDCVLELNTGVVKIKSDLKKKNEQEVKKEMFNIYGEKMCQYAEQVVKSGRPVRIVYTESTSDRWDDFRKVAHGIRVLNPGDPDLSHFEIIGKFGLGSIEFKN